ncbi:MAG: tetratricopeptide repeat protein, partial [Candidatus Methylomirabilia bacterium]
AVRAGAIGALTPSVVRLTVAAVGVWVASLAALTVSQVQVWRDTDTLWRYAIEVNPECSICHSALGTYLVNRGYTASGLGHLEQAVALRQDRIPHASLGLAFLNTGRLPEAVEQLRLALERDPDDVGARNNLAVALLRQGTPEEAMAHLAHVIRRDPEHVGGHMNLGAALTSLGRPAEALDHVRRAIELSPESAFPHFELARAYMALGWTDAARQEYEILRRLDPRLASAFSRLVNPAD